MGHLPDDREPEPRPADLSRRCEVGLVELVEDEGKLAGRDPGAGVLNDDHEVAVPSAAASASTSTATWPCSVPGARG